MSQAMSWLNRKWIQAEGEIDSEDDPTQRCGKDAIAKAEAAVAQL